MTVVVTPMVLRLLGVLIIGLVVWGLRETRKPEVLSRMWWEIGVARSPVT
jgi:hypothetical protein